MGYQFLHIEGYARQGSRQGGKTRKWSASEIAAEAMRDPDACPHVEQPKAPKVLYGGTPREAAELAESWANNSKDALGRGLRRDGLALASGVVSMPAEMAGDWGRFREATVAWLREQYGPRLRSVVEHIDEAYPHLHFYAVPLAGERFEVLHPGREAAAKKAQEGGKKGAQNAQYKAAMQGWQDDFQTAVAARFGLLRHGPKRRRLTRGAWVAEQAQAKGLAQTQLPAGLKVKLQELEPKIVGKSMLGVAKYEPPAVMAARINGMLQKRFQPLLNAAKQAEAAVVQAGRIEQRVSELEAHNKLMSDALSLFSPDEILARRAEVMSKQKQALAAELEPPPVETETAIERVQREVAEEFAQMIKQQKPEREDDGPGFDR